MIDVSVLLKFRDFSVMGDVALMDIAEHAELKDLPVKNRLDASEQQGKRLYLIDGEVQLMENQRKVQLVSEKTERAASEIFRVSSPGMCLVTTKPSKLLFVDNSLVSKYAVATQHQAHEGIFLQELSGEDYAGEEHALLVEIRERFVNRDIKLPSLPSIAQRINAAVQSDDTDMNHLAKIIQTDPAIAARIINVANSALFASGGKAETVRESLLRIGIKAVRGLVLSVILRNLFQPKLSIIVEQSRRYYFQSIEIGVIASVISSRLNILDADQAFLAGLLHNVGVLPILIAADSSGLTIDEPGVLDALMKELKTQVGALLLTEWEFDEDLINVVNEVDNFQRGTGGGEADYCDVVQMAVLHNRMMKKQPLNLVLSELSSFRRLGMHKLDPRESLAIFADVKREMAELARAIAPDYTSNAA